MVKRLLTIAVIALASVATAQAQKLQRDPARPFVGKAHPAAAKAPAKVASLEGTTLFGYGNSGTWGGLGINKTGTLFDVAIFLPGGMLSGAMVQGVNLPVGDSGMTNVSVWARTALGGDNLAEGTTEGPFIEGEYLAVPFDEAVEIPASGIYVGYSFTCSVNYPIATDYYDEPVENSLFLQYNGGGWSDYSLGYGPSVLQVFLANLTLPDHDVTFNSIGSSTQLPSSEYSLPVTFTSNSAKDIQSLDLAVTVDGQTETKHIDLSTPVESGLFQAGSFNITGTSPAATGLFTADIKVAKVNGIDYEAEATATAQLKNVSKIVPRRTVIEEFTGTGCGWCPRGWAGMEYMKEHHPDDFIGIAFHKYNSGDPMYYSNYPMLGLTGAPSCIIDRKEIADPYYGNANYMLGIEDDFKRLNAEIPEVDVTVEAQWNEGQTAVNIDAEVEFLGIPASASLVYVLTADSLRGTATSWKQTNYYANYYTKEQMAGEEILEEFGSGGKYGSSSTALTFNDVVVSSSYNTSGVNQGPTITPDEGYFAGSAYRMPYILNAPTKATVKNVVKKELVTAIVLVVDKETGYILNAAKAHVEAPDAIRDITSQATDSLSARYNMAGQAISSPQRGINIVRMADGSVRKVLVK